MISARLRNKEEFHKHWDSNAHIYRRIEEIENNLAKNKREFTVKGFSYPAQCEVNFLVDYLYSDNVHINWRERVVCPVTGLNNRLRASVHFIDFELHPKDNSRIYIAEQTTPLYRFLKEKYRNIIGSEFLGNGALPGQFDEQRGFRHEDATKLSFKNKEMDFYLSFECFDHIADYLMAFAESYRILKDDGMMYFTVHFAANDYKNIIRATVSEDGNINHILPPQYSGDPLSDTEGILCYTHFGWELFDQLKKIGFKDAYAIHYWSDSLGYFGGGQFLFCAIK